MLNVCFVTWLQCRFLTYVMHDVVNGFGVLQVEAVIYQTVKDVVKQQFLSNHAGPWNSKKLVDCFST